MWRGASGIACVDRGREAVAVLLSPWDVSTGVRLALKCAYGLARSIGPGGVLTACVCVTAAASTGRC
jgi:hypothetical protein